MSSRPVQRSAAAGTLSEWFRELRAPLRRFIARRRGVATADLDDVAQEVFLRLLRYDRSESVGEPRAYLFQVAANVASEWSMRARQRLPHASCWLDDLVDESDLADATERAERFAELHRALALLPPRSREILRLRFGDGLTNELIAKRLNVSPRIVKRDMVRAYMKLRMELLHPTDPQTRESSRIKP